MGGEAVLWATGGEWPRPLEGEIKGGRHGMRLTDLVIGEHTAALSGAADCRTGRASVSARYLIGTVGVLLAFATQGIGIVAASAPPVTGCAPTACTPGTTVG